MAKPGMPPFPVGLQMKEYSCPNLSHCCHSGQGVPYSCQTLAHCCQDLFDSA